MLRVNGVSKHYKAPGFAVPVLHDVTPLAEGEACPLVGPSGSGKSTLPNVIELPDESTDGEVSIDGLRSTGCPAHQPAHLRNRLIGFVFHSFQLLPRLSAWAKVARPLQYCGVPRRERRAAAEGMLDRVGLAARAEHLPGSFPASSARVSRSPARWSAGHACCSPFLTPICR